MEDIVTRAGEQLVICRDRGTGMRAVIAVDDTRRGPGLGGVRYRPYGSITAAAREAQRLAEAMTRKHAAAGLPYGGAKAVILDNGLVADREQIMLAFGGFVARLAGTYIPGVDMGTTVADLAAIATVAPDVACHDEDPSPWTAMGVWAAIGAAVTGERAGDLSGVKVVVQGAGHVGASLASQLHASGADVVVADVDVARARLVAERVDGVAIAAGAVLDEPCDVLSPCAVARVVDAETVARLRCRWVVGAANDTLASEDVATLLAARGIAYVPDFVVNAGGVIHIHALREGWSTERLSEEVLRVGDRVARIVDEAARDGRTPLDVAERLVAAALAGAGSSR
jgi:leucine dehydrogenase